MRLEEPATEARKAERATWTTLRTPIPPILTEFDCQHQSVTSVTGLPVLVQTTKMMDKLANGTIIIDYCKIKLRDMKWLSLSKILEILFKNSKDA